MNKLLVGSSILLAREHFAHVPGYHDPKYIEKADSSTFPTRDGFLPLHPSPKANVVMASLTSLFGVSTLAVLALANKLKGGETDMKRLYKLASALQFAAAMDSSLAAHMMGAKIARSPLHEAMQLALEGKDEEAIEVLQGVNEGHPWNPALEVNRNAFSKSKAMAIIGLMRRYAQHRAEGVLGVLGAAKVLSELLDLNKTVPQNTSIGCLNTTSDKFAAVLHEAEKEIEKLEEVQQKKKEKVKSSKAKASSKGAKAYKPAEGEVEASVLGASPRYKLGLAYERMLRRYIQAPKEDVVQSVVGKRFARSVLENGGNVSGIVYPFKSVQNKAIYVPRIFVMLDGSASMSMDEVDGYDSFDHGVALAAALGRIAPTRVVIHASSGKILDGSKKEGSLYFDENVSPMLDRMGVHFGSGEGRIPEVPEWANMVVMITDFEWGTFNVHHVRRALKNMEQELIVYKVGDLEIEVANYITRGQDWRVVWGWNLADLGRRVGKAFATVSAILMEKGGL